MSLAGHVSRKMMELYSHTRNEAKRSAISARDAGMSPEQSPQTPHSSEAGIARISPKSFGMTARPEGFEPPTY